jgi:hypothetical protein
LQAGEFVVANPDSGVSLSKPLDIGEHVFTVGQIVNYGVALALLISMIVFFVNTVMEAVRLVRALRPHAIVTQSNGII